METTRIIWAVSNASFKTQFIIPVGGKSKTRAKQSLAQLMNNYKEVVDFDWDSASLTTNGKPMLQFNKEYWLPSKDGEQPEIETLGGDGPELSDTESLKYFSDKLKAVSKIPYNRFMYEVYGSESYVFTIDLSLDSLFFQSKKYISPLALYEYYAIELWKTTNFSQPHLVSTSDYLLSYRYYDTNESYIFLREGRYYNQYKQPASAISIYPYEKNYDVYIGAINIGLWPSKKNN
jgi:hypothetical protein